MNESLIIKHNEVVKPDDHVYMLGDFAFAVPKNIVEVLEQMNGKKYFIFGNHDKNMKKPEVAEHFEWMRSYHELKVGKRTCVLFHFPIFSWNKMSWGSYHFYGHTHGQIPHLYHGRSMDIGVDTNDGYPYDIEHLFAKFKRVKEMSDDDENFYSDGRGREEIR